MQIRILKIRVLRSGSKYKPMLLISIRISVRYKKIDEILEIFVATTISRISSIFLYLTLNPTRTAT